MLKRFKRDYIKRGGNGRAKRTPAWVSPVQKKSSGLFDQ